MINGEAISVLLNASILQKHKQKLYTDCTQNMTPNRLSIIKLKLTIKMTKISQGRWENWIVEKITMLINDNKKCRIKTEWSEKAPDCAATDGERGGFWITAPRIREFEIQTDEKITVVWARDNPPDWVSKMVITRLNMDNPSEAEN